MTEKDERWEQVEEGVELLETGDADRAVEESSAWSVSTPKRDRALLPRERLLREGRLRARAEVYVKALELQPGYLAR